MKEYREMTSQELTALREELRQEYSEIQARGLSLNMARGKPDAEQLALSDAMWTIVDASTPMVGEDGMDYRNYGLLFGTREARRLMGEIMGVSWENVIVGGSSSLTMMYDTLMRGLVFGMLHSPKPWYECPDRKFLCLVPGYDRHFAITQDLGFELVTVPLTEAGPDMDLVEELVKDPSVKGIWCVPKYSNPSGITYSDETVRRLAAMETAAPDFTIMWDNAYGIHHLYPDAPDELADIFALAREYGHEDRVIAFASTSKVTYPGAGIAALAASKANLDHIAAHMTHQTIGADKINMLRHVLFLQDLPHVKEHMAKHAALLRPKFELVLRMFEEQLREPGVAQWTNPRGGYFITCQVPEGCAKKVVRLCAEAGVILTDAGATHPYKKDPQDSAIRIAPSYPPIGELEEAMKVFCLCVRLAAVEKLLGC